LLPPLQPVLPPPGQLQQYLQRHAAQSQRGAADRTEQSSAVQGGSAATGEACPNRGASLAAARVPDHRLTIHGPPPLVPRATGAGAVPAARGAYAMPDGPAIPGR